MLAQIGLNLCFVCVRRGSAVGVNDLLHDVPFLPVSASLLRWMNPNIKSYLFVRPGIIEIFYR
jgi:hypothetical protein